jgi:hypothetical protein
MAVMDLTDEPSSSSSSGKVHIDASPPVGEHKRKRAAADEAVGVVDAQLKLLRVMFARGSITEEEHNNKRKQLIDNAF